MLSNFNKKRYSIKVLIQLSVTICILTILAILNSEFLINLYLSHQLPIIGQAINGGIVLILGFGLTHIVYLLFTYHTEENSIASFNENIIKDIEDPIYNVDPSSLIARRYLELRGLHDKQTPIDHGALSSILVAEQSILTSVPKFLFNILILMGVLGTILSLAIALTGASDLLTTLTSLKGMPEIINGMSTALSTTITAIIAYLIFGYFFTKLTDIQTYILQSIEKTTTLYLMPKFDITESTLLQKLVNTTNTLSSLADKMKETQSNIDIQSQKLGEVTSSAFKEINAISQQMNKTNRLLAKGFRISGDEQDG